MLWSQRQVPIPHLHHHDQNRVLHHSGPAEPEAGLIIRDNNYEDEHRFSKLVDSKEIYAKKVKAGHIKNRRRNSSIESTPELSFHPKRQDDNDDTDHEPPPRSYKPPVTV